MRLISLVVLLATIGCVDQLPSQAHSQERTRHALAAAKMALQMDKVALARSSLRQAKDFALLDGCPELLPKIEEIDSALALRMKHHQVHPKDFEGLKR